ncbi:MAG: multifunctional oxoglutarate decarboxylase/oxoglutarate dehydrogenase thiamine pyrophosphate-binding subunit/dihydrolipoyllysine-residue succinyltransferase subunit [Thermoleophilia bacterium]|nr:multifunctional oxoglutarate decarboxylase/oxoglutarate dehydrogenase thiamine pyrophosphate-binding subunit/dihydrolipoyllysine-residue succinyltransferase subunit [Thermoleophilia bacterium]
MVAEARAIPRVPAYPRVPNVTTAGTTIHILLPVLGESVTEGTVIEWKKSIGDTVEEGETLLEVTTDKVDVEIPAPASGVLQSISAAAGVAVAVGALLGEMVSNNGTSPVAAAPRTDAGPATLVPIQLPDMESVTEGTVVAWKKAVGDPVARDEIVVEVSTDKVDLEVPSPATGTLAEIAAPDGAVFDVTRPLGTIAVGIAATNGAPTAHTPPAAASAPPPPLRDVAASPIARRVAFEQGIDLDTVDGTGPGGLIRRADVEHAGQGEVGSGGIPVPAPPPGEALVKLTGPAAALAEYMDESRSIPTATTFRTISVAMLDAERRRLNEALAVAGGGKLSFTHIVAWAIVRAIEQTPVMATAFARVDGSPHKVPRDTIDLGIAVDVERKDGSHSLLVPVIRDCTALGFQEFRAAFDDLIQRSRVGKISPDELRGAGVTLTNPGGFGTTASVPRLMSGQGTIVATGGITWPSGLEDVPGALLAQWGVSKVVTVTSTYDHRVIQGAESGAFLRDIAGLLAGDDAFYDEIRTQLSLPSLPPLTLDHTADASSPAAPDMPATADEETLRSLAGAMSLLRSFRTYGHLAAHLDPLGSAPPGDPSLDPAWVGLTHEMMAMVPASLLGVAVPGITFADAYPALTATYCSTIAYELEHISDHDQRQWLREFIESGQVRTPLPPGGRTAVLDRLISVEVFERFLRRTYIGQKTFSLEGCDALIPMMDETIEMLAANGVPEVIIGMAHRGRLASITHTVGRPPESVLAEFEGHVEDANDEHPDGEPYAAAGDVKYHLGAEGTFASRTGKTVHVTLAANPSHLEQVNAVTEGRTRARQTLRAEPIATHDASRAVAVLIHGDAAFPGQGVVAETLNLQDLAGYTTGGTIHVIVNNQVGFTTDPEDSRSTRYASDLAKGFDMPIVHVNADDIDACMAAVRLAVTYRERFQDDVLIDLIGYRRLGHNELDEPAYTQPVMARTIKDHPTVARLYADRLIADGVITDGDYTTMTQAAENRMAAAHKRVVSGLEQGSDHDTSSDKRRRARTSQVKTAVSATSLRSLNEQLHLPPDGFEVHAKLTPQLDRRRAALSQDSAITWAHAEALAFASLLTDGVPIRLTGQDVARGTFSQRHVELHEISHNESYIAHKGEVYVPLQHLLRAKASFEIHNSPLSESACVGFEYGYSTQAPEALVLWEAQYGDFANGAQIMIDQFISAGQAKWGVHSRLTLLLPHGYEGNGPEHSSGRPERFLRLAAEGNMRIANCSTADNYFHLLRRQGLLDEIRPLVVFTPKSLLRAKAASCSLEDLTKGRFQPVIPDPRAVGHESKVTRLMLCTGKIFHELDAHADRENHPELAIGRIEQLYPFPREELLALYESYPGLETVQWVQEEPRNMGAWSFVTRRIERLLPITAFGYVGRPARASVSEGYPQTHQLEQQRVLEDALVGREMTFS